MKHNFHLLRVAACLSAHALAASAQQFSVDWLTIDGGGGTSTGGAFSVSGTIGQPDAGLSSGGSFTLQGGFWALDATGSPQLQLALAANNVILSWPTNFSGFQLEQATSLAPCGTWTPVTASVVVVNDRNSASQPLAAGARFFRLRRL